MTDSQATTDARPPAGTQPDAGRGVDRIRRHYGRFEVTGTLGAGGMGIVVEAHDPDLGRSVAIKILHPDRGPDLAQLGREARAMARLAHPNVVTVYEVGTVEDQSFVAMELVAGTTLRGWLGEAARSHDEIVAIYVAAGRGLAAAHSEGIVHRDFKPDNVLVGGDGRARVGDFGLAAPPDEPSPPRGAGTAWYQAPEQWRGGRVDARADQFAFCVALWEALTGARPFAGATPGALPDAVCAGALDAPVVPLPRAEEAALRRGLATDPDARWPTLAALLDALERGLARRRARRWWLVVATAAIGALAIGLAIATWTREPVAAPCAQTARPFAELWSAPERARIQLGFVGHGGPYAPSTWPRVAAAVDAWGGRWTAMRRDVCEATEVRREQSAALLDRRMACLEDRRRELAEVLAIFATADIDIVTGAQKALGQLEPIARCADVAALSAIDPPAPGIAAEVAVVRRELASLAARARLTGDPHLVERAHAALATARRLGYPQLAAEALYTLGIAQIREGSFEPAVASLREAVLAADRASDDRQRAWAWIQMTWVMGAMLRRGDEALYSRDQAVAVLARVSDRGDLELNLHHHAAGAYAAKADYPKAFEELDLALTAVGPSTDPLLHALLLNTKGTYLADAHRPREALAAYGEVRAIYAQVLGPDHPYIAALLSNVAMVALRSEDAGPSYAEQEHMLRDAIAIGERSLGPDHPNVANFVNNLVNLYLRLQRFAEAAPLAARVVAIRERALPPDHPLTARAVINTASILAGAGRFADAEPWFARGLAIQARSLPAVHYDRAYAHMLHGINLLDLSRPADARRELDTARRIHAGVKAPDHAEVLAWYARAQLEAGDLRGGLATAEAALALVRKDPSPYVERLARWHLARAWMAIGRRREARAATRALIGELALDADPDMKLLRGKIERWLAAQTSPTSITPD